MVRTVSGFTRLHPSLSRSPVLPPAEFLLRFLSLSSGLVQFCSSRSEPGPFPLKRVLVLDQNSQRFCHH